MSHTRFPPLLSKTERWCCLWAHSCHKVLISPDIYHPLKSFSTASQLWFLLHNNLQFRFCISAWHFKLLSLGVKYQVLKCKWLMFSGVKCASHLKVGLNIVKSSIWPATQDLWKFCPSLFEKEYNDTVFNIVFLLPLPSNTPVPSPQINTHTELGCELCQTPLPLRGGRLWMWEYIHIYC